ncbi:hypothetical protein FA95DRAFT_107693 [Auriscalpium vulgare]|uniref:Uncharacterized protein n=1 Tax=Auriscalpium vulgare TaxID=40419 RepID=A0ACB8S736_9AGAM|nr:hypothetical protein FA95DRAFT_107693 [Auriscalpium vulgare]
MTSRPRRSHSHDVPRRHINPSSLLSPVSPSSPCRDSTLINYEMRDQLDDLLSVTDTRAAPSGAPTSHPYPPPPSSHPYRTPPSTPAHPTASTGPASTRQAVNPVLASGQAYYPTPNASPYYAPQDVASLASSPSPLLSVPRQRLPSAGHTAARAPGGPGHTPRASSTSVQAAQSSSSSMLPPPAHRHTTQSAHHRAPAPPAILVSPPDNELGLLSPLSTLISTLSMPGYAGTDTLHAERASPKDSGGPRAHEAAHGRVRSSSSAHQPYNRDMLMAGYTSRDAHLSSSSPSHLPRAAVPVLPSAGNTASRTSGGPGHTAPGSSHVQATPLTQAEHPTSSAAYIPRILARDADTARRARASAHAFRSRISAFDAARTPWRFTFAKRWFRRANFNFVFGEVMQMSTVAVYYRVHEPDTNRPFAMVAVYPEVDYLDLHEEMSLQKSAMLRQRQLRERLQQQELEGEMRQQQAGPARQLGTGTSVAPASTQAQNPSPPPDWRPTPEFVADDMKFDPPELGVVTFPTETKEYQALLYLMKTQKEKEHTFSSR